MKQRPDTASNYVFTLWTTPHVQGRVTMERDGDGGKTM